MTHAAHIALIEHELNGFHQSLVIYRQQMDAWYSRALDSVSHGLDMPSLLGGRGKTLDLYSSILLYMIVCAIPLKL